jgi:Secretion system C-terminal sorting domain
MKKIILLLILTNLFSQNIWAGPVNGGLNEKTIKINPNQPGAVQGNISKEVAYFNTKNAPVKKFPIVGAARTNGISITEADFLSLLQPNMTFALKTADTATTFSMNIGIADMVNAQTWTLPSTGFLTLFNQYQNIDFIAPSTVPTAAQVTGATHVGRRDYFDSSGNPITEYFHFELLPNEPLDEMGVTFVQNGITNNFGEAPQEFLDAPLDLGDAYNSSVAAYKNNAPLPKKVYNSHTVVDAFGTISNPFGSTPATFNCLRLSICDTVRTYTTSATTPSSVEIRYSVGWMTKEGFRFFAKKPAATASGTTILNRLSASSFAPTTVLAVELIDFQGIETEKGITLSWTTASETNNDYFNIERSNDGRNFEKIGQVKGNGTTNQQNHYRFGDKSRGGYYRLTQVDFDGTTTSSNIISVKSKKILENIKAYPNPASDHLTINYSSTQHETANYIIINQLGQIVLQGNLSVNEVDISSLPMGVFTLKIGEDQVKFIKQ